MNCDHNIISYGRRRREIVSQAIQTINGTTVVKLNRSEFDSMSSFVNEMPLEYVMIVRDPKFISDRLVFGDNKILVAGYGNIKFNTFNIFCGMSNIFSIYRLYD